MAGVGPLQRDGHCHDHWALRRVLHYNLIFSSAQKVLANGLSGGLALKTFATLAVGVALWVLYGFLKSDIVIILANVISFCFS